MSMFLAAAVCFAIASPSAGVPPAPAPAAPTTVAPDSAEPKSEFEKRLETIDARSAEVRTLRGRFVQKKHTQLLKKPMESSGTVVIKGDKTRWETLEPRKTVMTIDGEGLRIYFPEQKVVEVYGLGDDAREFAGSPLPRLSALRASFDISQAKNSELGASDDDDSLVAIELLPRSEELKEHVTRVRVLIDSSVPAARRIEIVDADGEKTEIEFKDVEINKNVADEDLILKLPAGTREVHPLGEAAPAKPKGTAK